MNCSKIGIVTVLYNSENVLKEFFETLNIQTYKNLVLYIVDNKSPDNSLLISKKLAKTLNFETIIIENNENFGVAKGNNIGIKQALKDNCEMILLSNNDIVLEENTIDLLLNGLNEENATMSVPKIYMYQSNKIWCAGGDFNHKNGTTSHRGIGNFDSGEYDKREYVEYTPTCFMLIKSSVFDRVGYMDEKYFVYFDDTDFLYRAIIKNTEKLVYIPQSTIQHNDGSSTGGLYSPFSIFFMNRNRLYFSYKNLTFKIFLKVTIYSYIKLILKFAINYKGQYKIWKKGIEGLSAGLNLIYK